MGTVPNGQPLLNPCAKGLPAGEVAFTTNSFGKPLGFICKWCMLIYMIKLIVIPLAMRFYLNAMIFKQRMIKGRLFIDINAVKDITFFGLKKQSCLFKF
jgi:hypothetical protein